MPYWSTRKETAVIPAAGTLNRIVFPSALASERLGSCMVSSAIVSVENEKPSGFQRR